MKRLVLLAWVLCGCASGPQAGNSGAVVAAWSAVECASLSARKATERTAAAKAALQVAAAKSLELMTVASVAERPLVAQLEAAVETTRTELDAAQAQWKAADRALADSAGRMEALQGEFRAMSGELAKAQEEENRLKASRDFWRASAWKLALLALALGVWTLRKPLWALCGGLVG